MISFSTFYNIKYQNRVHMRRLCYLFLLMAIGCIDSHKYSQSTTQNNSNITNNSESSKKENKMILSEDSLGIIRIPISLDSLLDKLKENYPIYQVSKEIGQQDGPNYPYINIADEYNTSLGYINYDGDKPDKLNDIHIVSSDITDEYGITVGMDYDDIIKLRGNHFSNQFDYHHHVYLYDTTSNIFYEITGDFQITAEMLENIEDMVLNEQQLRKCTVTRIIWRKRK